MTTLSKKRFMKDLTRTRHMTIVSAVVLGTIFMPLLGIPEMYEVQAFQNAVDGLADSPAMRRDDEAARQRSAEVVTGEQPTEDSWWQRIAVRRRNVEEPRPVERPDDEQLLEMIAPDGVGAPVEPLPVADADETLPAVEELEPLADGDATPEAESEELEPLPEIDEPEKPEEAADEDLP